MFEMHIWYEILSKIKEPVYFLGRRIMFTDLTVLEQEALVTYLSDKRKDRNLRRILEDLQQQVLS